MTALGSNCDIGALRGVTGGKNFSKKTKDLTKEESRLANNGVENAPLENLEKLAYGSHFRFLGDNKPSMGVMVST
ncbi:MAG: hypothetical protein IPP74_09270 [Alphaproteobacteria bacterium]|nr:hypothetical protein [Alphaproteobacteria bacterium]